MADPPDAGNPVRLISPFHKIVGVGWGKKPSGGTALIKFRSLVNTIDGGAGMNDSWGIGLRYQVNDEHGNPGTISPLLNGNTGDGGGDGGTGCFATTVQGSISSPSGFHSFFTDGPPWGSPNPGAYKGDLTGIACAGSVPIGTATKDLTRFYTVFENGMGMVPGPSGLDMIVPGYASTATGSYLDGAFDNGGSAELCEGSASLSQTDVGTVSFTYYAFVNLTKIVQDFGGTFGLANVFVDLYGAQYTSNPNVLSNGTAPLAECRIWENGSGMTDFPKFKGGADSDGFARGIIFDDTGPGTERTDLAYSATFSHDDLGAGSAALIHTITWNTSGPPPP